VKTQNIFQFKNFSMQQIPSGQRINTDSCVFGDLVAPSREPARILDIGAGTGLLTLMMANRFLKSKILGIESEKSAFLIAQDNIQKSPWSSRCQILHQACQELSHDQHGKFDLIICNPPFFRSSLKSRDSLRSMARHSDTLPSKMLLNTIKNLVSSDGSGWIMVPAQDEHLWISEGSSSELFCYSRISVRDHFDASPHMSIIEWRLADNSMPEIEKEIFYRQTKGGEYGQWMKDFRLRWFPKQFNK
jgi:tRNA1Val (adenine37-N6)-methyltransferase